MPNVAQPAGGPRTVQDYIDELPMWPDGTRLHSNPMTSMQWRIWLLAAAGTADKDVFPAVALEDPEVWEVR